MRQITVAAIFGAFITAKFEMPAAFVAHRIQRAITKQTVKTVFGGSCVTGKMFTFVIAEKSTVIFDNHI